jgi:hypothetical protein
MLKPQISLNMSYAPVSTSERFPSEPLTKKLSPVINPKYLTTQARILVAISVVIAVALTSVLIHVGIQNIYSPESCGGSSAEVISLGCIFDMMSFGWLPARCFDKELTDECLARQDWKWFLDPNRVEAIDFSDVAAGHYDAVYVTREYQLYHCTYMWRKMHRAMLAGRIVDGYIRDMHHTANCEMQILDQWLGLNDTSSMIYVKFATCPRVQKDTGRWGWYRVIDGHRVHRNP